MVHMSATALSQHFGELAKVRGIVIHKISPFEQKAFAGAISKGFPNTLRRISNSVFRIVPRKLNYEVYEGFLIYTYMKEFHHLVLDLVTIYIYLILAFVAGYLVYAYVEKLHNGYLRKNPAEFADDQ